MTRRITAKNNTGRCTLPNGRMPKVRKFLNTARRRKNTLFSKD
jgi:hypothetical protein